jgi:transcriptional regulator GlxA family with amidase domain
MRKFSLAAASGVEEESTIVDLCAELDISPRTLRYCCQLHLGMGPKRFLTIRRLNLVRQALQAVGPSNLNVTQAATAYGFWELGRFAVAYRELFGEMPSVTLRRHTGDPLLASDSGPAPNGPGAPFGFAPQWVAAAC